MTVKDSLNKSRKETLEALSQTLAEAIDDATSRDLPALVRQLREVLEELDQYEEPEEESMFEKLKRERAQGK